MRTFEVKTRWPKTTGIEKEIIVAEYYYNKKHSYTFVKEDKNIASFPVKSTTIMEVEK